MILCITLNPCLDKTLSVPAWNVGDNVRGLSVREVVGGKGNNVARALNRLNRQARPVSFFGGAVGAHCETLLREADGFEPVVVRTEAETRVILTVRTHDSADQTAFFDPDPAVSAIEAHALFQTVEDLLNQGNIEAVSLSGSSPSPPTHELYADLIGLAKSKRVPVFLDTYGPALEAIWGFRPDAIQLNRREAAAFLRQADATDADLERLLDDWSNRGTRLCLITDGPKPLLARVDGRRFRVVPPPIEVVNPIGSGDCVLAGLIDGRLRRLDPESLLRRAVACGAANALVWDAGAIELETVARCESAVVFEPPN